MIALLAGSVIILAYGESPRRRLRGDPRVLVRASRRIGYVLAIATPLDLLGARRRGLLQGRLFNIGVEGPVPLRDGGRPRGRRSTSTSCRARCCCAVAILFACSAGWSGRPCPRILKVKTGAHEVVTTIMMNGIAVSFVAWAFHGPLQVQRRPGRTLDVRTRPVPGQRARSPTSGSIFGFGARPHLSWLLPLAIVAAVVVWFLLRRMRLGYEARAVGASAGLGPGGWHLDRRCRRSRSS